MPVWTAARCDWRRTSRWHEVAAGHRDIRRERDSAWRPTPRSSRLEPAARTTSPCPSGCTRFDRKMTQTPVSGSTQMRRARESRVTERADRQQLTAVRRVARCPCPSPGHAWRRPHRHAALVIMATVSGDRMRTPFHVPPPAASARRSTGPLPSEQAGMAGIPTHSPCGGIVDDASQHRGARCAARPRERLARFRRRDARDQRRRWQERRVAHPERLEDPARGVGARASRR